MNSGDTNAGMTGSLRISPEESVVITVNSVQNDCSSDGDGSLKVFGIRAALNEGNAPSAASFKQDKRDAGKGKEKENFIDLIVECSGDDKVCRICHLIPEIGESAAAGWKLIQIGCGCKGELGHAHRRCAEAWFRLKRNRICEICGLSAKNVFGVEDSSFMELWNEGRKDRDDSVRCCTRKSVCNTLLYFIVGAFVVPWFFRPKFF
ncbi:hypothetical protein IEQ34_003660 [Dendrobium chrysotoxum]|uniref:RING-CH-type domain-containing protein n=1 Tax=Dendrobium chrysotoxum TaxID=161865 RepID=A0AAV7HC16_DENCH|nr:hypothetical protein IEQ34_003660 [Dendrobium chrysotoxum]